MTGGQELKAKVIGFDEDKDVAVLQIQIAEEKKVCSLASRIWGLLTYPFGSDSMPSTHMEQWWLISACLALQELLHPMTIGSSSDLLVGQRVYAIGNPFGLGVPAAWAAA